MGGELSNSGGLLGGCGAIYALASVARGRGKQLEEMLVAKWGGMPTTIALRHRDKFLDGVSKQRYHTAITAKLGIDMPRTERSWAPLDLSLQKITQKQTCMTPSTSWIDPEFGNDGDLSQTISP